jgi:hypothetical protein
MQHYAYTIFTVVMTAVMLSGVAHAVEGVTLINQNNALAGGITEGDAPGFPVTISQPGSYRLSSNLNVPSDTIGIEIQSNDVTMDLNGFRIRGNASSGRGIFVTPAPPPSEGFFGIVIRNGAISNFGEGINTANAKQSVVEHMRVSANRFNGIFAGEGSAVISNTVSQNGSTGIRVLVGSTVISNTAFQNALQDFLGIEHGIAVNDGSTVSSNTAFQNGGGGGILVFCPSSVIGNTALDNTGQDLSADPVACTRANNSPRP